MKVVVGGSQYGNHTLTRFYALHVGVLPPLVIILTIAHLTVFRRHGVTVSLVTLPMNAQGHGAFRTRFVDQTGIECSMRLNERLQYRHDIAVVCTRSTQRGFDK